MKIVHGMNGTRVHRAWIMMKHRCAAPHRYKRHAGRGIAVCPEWRDNFVMFFLDMGHPPLGMSLDRRDNSKGYSRDNCRWASQRQQSQNQERNVFVRFNGTRMCVSEAARRSGVEDATLRQRIKRGWKGTMLFRPSLKPYMKTLAR